MYIMMMPKRKTPYMVCRELRDYFIFPKRRLFQQCWCELINLQITHFLSLVTSSSRISAASPHQFVLRRCHWSPDIMCMFTTREDASNKVNGDWAWRWKVYNLWTLFLDSLFFARTHTHLLTLDWMGGYTALHKHCDHSTYLPAQGLVPFLCSTPRQRLPSPTLAHIPHSLCGGVCIAGQAGGGWRTMEPSHVRQSILSTES